MAEATRRRQPDARAALARQATRGCEVRMFFQNVYCGECEKCIGFLTSAHPIPSVYCLDCEAAVAARLEDNPATVDEAIEQRMEDSRSVTTAKTEAAS